MKPKSSEQDGMKRSAFTTLPLKNGLYLPMEFVARFAASSDIYTNQTQSGREIEFLHAADGALLDLVRDRSGELRLALLQDGVTEIRKVVRFGDAEFIPPKMGLSLARAIRFPSAIGANLPARELLGEIEDVLERYCNCDRSDRKLLAYFGLCSWVCDLLRVAPYLWVVGPWGFGKSNLLAVMSAICRRSLLAGDVSPAGLYHVITAYHPTLILDECEPGKDAETRRLLRILRAGSTKGPSVLRASGAYDLFGPKIVASPQGPEDVALESRGLFIMAQPLAGEISALTPDALEHIAEQLQPKLAAFRLHNYARLKSLSGSAVVSGPNPRVQDIVRALSLAILGDAELETELGTIVGDYHYRAGVERDGEPEWQVVMALLGLAHVRGPGAPVRWTCATIAEAVRRRAASHGESFAPSSKRVGSILKGLRLYTQRLGAAGRGLESSPGLKEKIHHVAKGLGICAGDLYTPDFPDAPSTCAYCERLGLNFDNKGKRLRYVPFSQALGNPEDWPDE